MERKGLSGSTLKLIAIITMLIDHVAAAVLKRFLNTRGSTVDGSLISGLIESGMLQQIYETMRDVGRIAFPIFCFLLVEGFEHTRDRRKYALRLGLFALLSEIPFDLAFSGCVLEFDYQNVFFTLFLGLLTMMVYRWTEEQVRWDAVPRTLLLMIEVLVGMGAAQLLSTDYGGIGVWCIMILYLFRKKRVWQIVAGCLAFFWWELPAVIAFLPIALYNGKRGWNVKYFFYFFYPVHLLLLYLICWGYGLGHIAVV